MNNRKNLIGISGRSGSGKDLVGKIIQYLTCEVAQRNKVEFSQWNEKNSDWEIKKYADKLKDIVCLLIGCTRLQLEDRVFKETPLGPEWDYWEYYDSDKRKNVISATKPEGQISYQKTLTPRKLMLILGTECGREMIHPDLWCNAMFTQFKPQRKGISGYQLTYGACVHRRNCDNCGEIYYHHKNARFCENCIDDDSFQIYPHWLITDVRFPYNEGKFISDRGGLLIGIYRKFSERFPEYGYLENYDSPYEIPKELKAIDSELYTTLTHESEELMGNFNWCDYVIINNGSVEELINEIEKILKIENII